MIIVSYDIESDRKRNRFSKFLKKFGSRMQYSVFEIKNSQRVLQNIINEVEYRYKKSFSGADSVFILNLCESCKKKMKKYGYSSNRDQEIVFFD